MAGDNLPETFAVYPLGGWQLDKGPNDSLVMTFHYVVATEEPKTQEELDKSLRSLKLYISAHRGTEFGSEVWKAAQEIIQAQKH
jgi:hypothetical protein